VPVRETTSSTCSTKLPTEGKVTECAKECYKTNKEREMGSGQGRKKNGVDEIKDLVEEKRGEGEERES